MYSQYNQWRFSTGGDVFTNNENYYINAWYYLSHLPELFFGLSNNTTYDTNEFIDYDLIYANTNIYRKIKNKLYAGLPNYIESIYNVKYNELGIFDSITSLKWIGQHGYRLFGIGPRIRWDTRDNLYSTLTGTFIDVGFINYSLSSDLKSTIQYVSFDARKFYSLDQKKKHVFAIQLFLERIYGRYIPFRVYPGLRTRAYHPNLYKNNSLSWLEAEYRARIWKELGCSIFGGVANSSNKLTEFTSTSLKPNIGMGLRLRLVPKDNVHLRLEYGIGSKSSNIYLSFTDAF